MPSELGEVLGHWPARCRKVDGQLFLAPGRLVHVARNGVDETVIQLDGVKFELAKKKPGFDQALVRLSNLPASCEHLGSRVVIEFLEPEKWSNLKDFSELMQRLQQPSEPSEPSTSAAAPLAAMPSGLTKQYAYLVEKAQVMTVQQFLEIHSTELAQSAPLPEAPSMDLAPLRVVAAAQRQQREGKEKHVSEADKAAIFRELPALQQLFSAAVPSMMNETQFWERCLKSRYFLTAAGHHFDSNSHPEDRLFDSLPPPVAPAVADDTSQAAHPETDLTGEFQRDPSLLHTAAVSGNLIGRLNERSAGILSQRQAAKPANLSKQLEKRRTLLRTAAQTFQEDLADRTSVKRHCRLLLSPDAPGPTTDAEVPVFLQSLRHQKAAAGGSISESGTRWVLKSSLDELLKAERLHGSAASAAESIDTAAAVAVLQHIWSSRSTEAELRGRLCQEAEKLLLLLENQQNDAVARALLPCLRRAVTLKTATP